MYTYWGQLWHYLVIKPWVVCWNLQKTVCLFIYNKIIISAAQRTEFQGTLFSRILETMGYLKRESQSQAFVGETSGLWRRNIRLNNELPCHHRTHRTSKLRCTVDILSSFVWGREGVRDVRDVSIRDTMYTSRKDMSYSGKGAPLANTIAEKGGVYYSDSFKNSIFEFPRLF